MKFVIDNMIKVSLLVTEYYLLQRLMACWQAEESGSREKYTVTNGCTNASMPFAFVFLFNDEQIIYALSLDASLMKCYQIRFPHYNHADDVQNADNSSFDITSEV